VSDATFRSLLRELQDDLERFRADLENEIASIVSVGEGEVDLIGPHTTRAQIDVLRGLQTGKPVAPRHRPKAKP
jgi:hypothetical protein